MRAIKFVVFAALLWALPALGDAKVDAAKAQIDRVAGEMARLTLEFEAAGKDAAKRKELQAKFDLLDASVAPDKLPPVDDARQGKELQAYRLKVLGPILAKWTKLAAQPPKTTSALRPPGRKLDCPAGSAPVLTANEGYCVSPEHNKQGPWRFWYADGKLKAETNWKNGVREGVRRSWDQSGRLRQEQHFRADVEDGVSSEWNDHGTKVSEIHWKMGKRHGTCRWWYDDGKAKEAITYDNGTLDGPTVKWHSTGKMADESRYRAGRMEGARTQWRSDGSLIVALCVSGDKETWRTTDPRKLKERPCK